MVRQVGRWLRSQLRTLLWWVWPTSPTSWSQLPGRLAPAAIQVARLSVAAVVAYAVAGRLIPAGAVDLTAPLTALLVVQASAVGTLRMGLVRVGAVLTGVLVAVLTAAAIGLTWWSLGLVVAASLRRRHGRAPRDPRSRGARASGQGPGQPGHRGHAGLEVGQLRDPVAVHGGDEEPDEVQRTGGRVAHVLPPGRRPVDPDRDHRDDAAAVVDRAEERPHGGPAVVLVRQCAAGRPHRARARVEARRPRALTSAEQTRTVLTSFQRAVATGDVQGLLEVLAPDVVLVADGGGLRQAALRPIVGAGKVVGHLAGTMAENALPLAVGPSPVNGSPALLVRLAGELDGVIAVRVEDGRVTGLCSVRNPKKLSRMRTVTPLTTR